MTIKQFRDILSETIYDIHGFEVADHTDNNGLSDDELLIGGNEGEDEIFIVKVTQVKE